MKTSYISPPTGALDITVVRDKDPYCTITLDLGIPNFTVFSLKMPVVPARPVDMTALLAEALAALLDEMSAFMLSMNYAEDIIVRIYATVLATFKEMTPESTTDAGMSSIGKDNTIVTYEGSFQLPLPFVNETYDKVVTGAQVVKRMPKQRHIELTVMKPNKVDTQDVGKLIRQYRGRSLKTQPKPMFVMVYDMRGRPAGTVPVGPNFKNTLLKKMRGSVPPPQYTEEVHFNNDTERKIQNVVGIPRNIALAKDLYLPEACCGDDMALYKSSGREPHYLVKFPDGRVVKFPARQSIRQLKAQNYPVPSPYYQWSLIKPLAPPAEQPENEGGKQEGTKLCSKCHVRPEWRDGLCHKCLSSSIDKP